MGFAPLISSLLRLIRPTLALALLIASFVFGFGCAATVDETAGEVAPIPQTPEATYYGTPTTYSGSVTVVSGTASYSRFDDTGVSGLNTVSTGHPIRFAEVHILNSSGARIQQGETDGNGLISLSIPRTAGSYTLRVNSRADNSQLRASVLNNPYDQVFYSHDTAFTLGGSEATKAVTIASASAANDSNLYGGAFNILDQLYLANEYIRTNGNVACGSVGCATNFTSAPKIGVYWSKGVSPGTYYGSPSSGISFFTNVSSGNVYRGLYILGGVQGEVCTDTDHFDRSVILHEYGHYLEAAYGKSSSPGGSHSGNAIIDPRLAWSEGWADYFQAAVLGRNFYRDTSKNSTCAGGASLSFNDFDMETKNADIPTANEGIFREMSVARNLYDIQNTAGTDGFGANLGFNVIWHAFKAMGGSTFKLQNSGQFNQLIYSYAQTIGDGTKITNLGDYNETNGTGSGALNNERQARNQNLYGLKLTAQSASCTFGFSPTPSAAGTAPKADVLDGSGNVIESDNLRNNHFFRYDYDGNVNNAFVTLNYSASGSPYDLDLYVYNENYVYLDGTTLAKYSVHTHPGGSSASESIDLSNKAPGTYVINVKVDYTTPKAPTTYYLILNSGQRLCP